MCFNMIVMFTAVSILNLDCLKCTKKLKCLILGQIGEVNGKIGGLV